MVNKTNSKTMIPENQLHQKIRAFSLFEAYERGLKNLLKNEGYSCNISTSSDYYLKINIQWCKGSMVSFKDTLVNKIIKGLESQKVHLVSYSINYKYMGYSVERYEFIIHEFTMEGIHPASNQISLEL